MGSKNIRGQIESSSASFVLKDGASTQLTLTHPASNTAARVLTLPANDADYNLPAVIHGGDTTKAVQFTTSSGTTATTLNMIASISSNRSFTFADGDSVVGGDSNSNDIITKAGSQTLLNKTLTSPTITGATFSIPDSDASHELTLTWNENEASSARVLNILVNGANRTVDLTGNLTLAANLTTTTGAITLAGDAGGSSLTLPASGTVAVTGDKLSVFAATSSSELAGVISDNTGSGALVFGTSPNLTTPVLGVATATTINKVTLTAPATGSTLTIADGKTLTASNTLTFTGTDSSSVAFGTGGTVTYTSNKLSVFSATTSAELAGVISDETGSSGGVLVFNNSPALTTPTITSPVITTDLTMNDAAELKYKGTADENYLGFKAPATVTASTTWTLPDGDGANGQTMVTDGSGTLSWGSAGGGSGINYIDNADFEQTADEGSPDGWTDQDTDFKITAEATGALRGTVSGYIEATASASANDAVYYAFTLDAADKNKLMRLSFDYDGDANYVADDMTVDIYDVTNAAAITPSVTNIGAGPGRFEALFVTTDSTSYRLRFNLSSGAAGGVTGLFIDDVRVTPELTVTANPKQPWTAFTADWNSSYTHGTGGSEQYFYARDGQDMLIKVVIDVGSGGSISSTLQLTIPDGYTLDTSIHSPLGRGDPVGYAHLYNTGNSVYGGMVVPASSTILRVAEIDGTNGYWDGTNPTSIGSGDNFGLFARIPIAEWAGSVVTTANSRVEYAYTDTTWDGSDSTTKYGPSGGAMGGSITSSALKTITWQTPIQPTDKIWLEFSKDQVNWVEANMARLGSGNEPVVNQINAAGTNGSGVHVYGISSTQTAVLFLQYKNIANDDSPAVAWDSSSAYWRLCKSSNPLGIGTGLATATQAGALEKNFRWQTKTASNQSSTNTSMITFNNITSGKTYRLDFKGDASSTDTTSTMRVLFYIPSGVESTESPTIGVDASGSYTWGTDVYVRISDSKLVKANASSIVIGALVDGTNSLLSNIAVTITELPNHEETTDFT